jgi:replicative DNA helicase
MEENNNSLNIKNLSYKKDKVAKVDLGRKEPQNISMERMILGAILLDKEAIDLAREILTEKSFYLPAHQYIFASAMTLSNINQPIDIVLLANQLERDGKLDLAGGPAYLIDLSNTVASSANMEYHCRIVAQKYIQRELIKVGSETISEAFNETKDVFELLDETEGKIYSLADNYTSKDPEVVGDVLYESVKSLQDRILKSKENKIQGIETGFKRLNELTGGWQNSDLIIVAGRPGMGKTAFTLALARNACILGGKSVAFFSLEMPIEQLMQRLISFEAEIDQNKVKSGTLQDHEFTQITSKIGKLQKANLFIDDTAGLTINDFRKKVRKLKKEKGLDMVIIDYLQLMNVNFGEGKTKVITNREQEIAFISRSLKAIAKELNIPIIALAQLSRQAEQRGKSTSPSRPMLSDLRESGSIEQDADMVIFLFRPDYYDKEAKDEEGMSLKGLAEIIVEKHRNGEPGVVKARFIGQYVKYVDFDENEFISEHNQNLGGLTSNTPPYMQDDFSLEQPPYRVIKSKINKEDKDESFGEDDYT